MDWLEFLFFFVFTSGTMAALKLNFLINFANAQHKVSYYLLYLAFTYCNGLINQWAQSYWFTTLTGMLFVICIGYPLLRMSVSSTLLASILVECIGLLAFGLVNTLCSILSPLLIPISRSFSAYLGIGSILASLGLLYLGFQVVLKRFYFDKSAMKQYFLIFFLPVLSVLLACGYIADTFYGNVTVVESSGVVQPGVNHGLMLLFQGFAGALLFSTLYACQKLSEGFAAQTRLALLEQQLLTQRDYLQEAGSRYTQTQAFRHDIKSHLSALWGLLAQGETKKATLYLSKLDAISEALSFPCKTGNTVVDTLLSGKLSVAQQNGIQIECTVKIPAPCAVDDLDLCVLFSNAVDNAIRACGQQGSESYIRISGKEKGDFFMIEIENSCPETDGYQKGIGLANIEAVAEKYHGAVTAEKQGHFFRLNVLLIISRRLSDISV